EDDGHSLRRELFQGIEQFLLLRLADAGRRLIKDQDPGTGPEQPQNLELLAFAHRQSVDIRFRRKTELESGRQLQKLPRCGSSIREKPAFSAKNEIVQQSHRRKVQGILVKHSDTQSDSVRR